MWQNILKSLGLGVKGTMRCSIMNFFLQFFDGWEMNGKIFPSADDHALPMSSRAQEMCGRAVERVGLPTMFSSQNAALIQFRVPNRGEGFSFRVTFVQNPDRESIPNLSNLICAGYRKSNIP